MKADNCCSACDFYQANKEKHGDEGLCKRFPPKVFPVPQHSQITGQPSMMQYQVFPNMKAADWCGEFKTAGV